MRDRIASLLLGCAALLLFWALFVPKPAAPANASRPQSHDRGAAGYAGLWRWLRAAGIPVLQLRERYASLSKPGMLPSAGGNVLLVTLPTLEPVRAAEWPQLDAWVKRGNTVLVMAALDDTPRWTERATSSPLDSLKHLTGLTFTAIAPATGGRVRLPPWKFTPTHVALRPMGRSPWFTAVRTVATASDLPASRWRALPQDIGPLLAIARRADNGDPAVWLMARGQGRLLISAYADPFGNGQLGLADNARWLSSILAQALGTGGRVIFDDAHQGVVDYYDPKAFFGDPRLHRTLLWLIFLWLLFVVGSQRLRRAKDPVRPIDDTALLQASAAFFANILPPSAAGLRLLEHFFNDLRRRLGLPPNGQPLWDWLEAHGGCSRESLAELRRFHERAQSGRRLNLSRLHLLLHQLAGTLA